MQFRQTDKLPRFLLYHQEMLVNIYFLTGEDVLPERASTMNRFEY